MDFVVMVNTESKGVQSPTMTKGNSKADLYKQLVYSYEGKDWSTNIPMWGEGTIASIQSGEYNIGELTLQRAIAKVNVTVNDGKGLENFEITNVSLHNYNNGDIVLRPKRVINLLSRPMLLKQQHLCLPAP